LRPSHERTRLDHELPGSVGRVAPCLLLFILELFAVVF